MEAQQAQDRMRDVSTGPDTLLIEADFPTGRPDELFAAWTVPEQLTRWWPQQAEIEPGIGGVYHLSWPGMGWHLRGEYTAWEPGSHLAFTWRWDHDLREMTSKQVDVRFVATAEGTRVMLSHGTYANSAAAAEERQGHLEGWRSFLGNLQALYVADVPGHDAVS